MSEIHAKQLPPLALPALRRGQGSSEKLALLRGTPCLQKPSSREDAEPVGSWPGVALRGLSKCFLHALRIVHTLARGRVNHLGDTETQLNQHVHRTSVP